MEVEDDEVNVIDSTSGSEYLDVVIGHIENIVMSEQFQALQRQFMDTYWRVFEDSEENKLEYTDVYHDYTETFERYLTEELMKRMSTFDMERFSQELDLDDNYRDILDSEIFELLHSFGNFQTFKDLMLDYRRQMQGETQHMDDDILMTKPMDIQPSPDDDN